MTEEIMDHHDYVEAAARFSWSESGYVGFEEFEEGRIAKELEEVDIAKEPDTTEVDRSSIDDDLDYAVPAPRASTT